MFFRLDKTRAVSVLDSFKNVRGVFISIALLNNEFLFTKRVNKEMKTKSAKIKVVVNKSNSGQFNKYMVKPKYTDP